jgi:NTP pyrophosphatase (non-canonical NTP hydrolase)
MSEMSTLQRTVASFAEEAGIEALVHVRLLHLVSEVDELSKEVLKVTDYGRAPLNPPESWAVEMGDVLFTLMCPAKSTSEYLEAALDKYCERMTLGDDAGSGG